MTLKLISFDYIRAGYEGKDFRRICKPSKEGAVFQDRSVWELFREEHFDTIEALGDEEPTVQEDIAAHPTLDMVDVLTARDARWKEQAEKPLKRNFKHSVRRLDDRLEDAKPKAVLRQVSDLLDSIDTEQDSFTKDSDVAQLVRDINRKTYELKKILGQ